MGAVVEIEGLVKEFESGAGTLRVLDGLVFSLGEGEAVSVVGTSGCGKSTLLNIVGTLDEASSGTVRLFGEDVSGMGEKERAVLRAKNVGFVFQMHHLLPQCTVLENVLVPTLALGKGEGGDVARAKQLLERVGLAARTGHVPAQLSGGGGTAADGAGAGIDQPAEAVVGGRADGGVGRGERGGTGGCC